ncbi:flagella basal body P-ring formation protein FlgA [Nitratiruptor sp. YY09-18]|nr:flagella basal body P-ring formation protein FlgA [Nitratiruptor sp. YY09-18]
MGDTKVVLKESIVVKKDIHLFDIATIESDDIRVKEYLANLPIGHTATADGKISKSEVVSTLAESLINPAKVHIVGDAVSIIAASPLTKEQLVRMVEEYVKQHYKDVTIKRIHVTLDKPVQNWRIKITPSSQSFSHIYLNIDIYTDNKKLLTKRASVTIERYGKAYVALHDIPRGSPITAQDVEAKRVRLTNSAITLPKSVVGSLAATNIKAGRIIKSSMIKPDYPVKRHKNVKIIYERGPIQIELLGLALQDGAIGEIVKVKNLSSNKVIQCKVLKPGVVQFVY